MVSVFVATRGEGCRSDGTALRAAREHQPPRPVLLAGPGTDEAGLVCEYDCLDAVANAEFSFRGPSALHDGELVRFQNSGFLVHPIQGIGVKNARNARRLTALLRAANDKEAPELGISFPEFAGPLSRGGVQQELITERPGIYVLACILRTQDGREQTQLGMERTIRIVR